MPGIANARRQHDTPFHLYLWPLRHPSRNRLGCSRSGSYHDAEGYSVVVCRTTCMHAHACVSSRVGYCSAPRLILTLPSVGGTAPAPPARGRSPSTSTPPPPQSPSRCRPERPPRARNVTYPTPEIAHAHSRFAARIRILDLVPVSTPDSGLQTIRTRYRVSPPLVHFLYRARRPLLRHHHHE